MDEAILVRRKTSEFPRAAGEIMDDDGGFLCYLPDQGIKKLSGLLKYELRSCNLGLVLVEDRKLHADTGPDDEVGVLSAFRSRLNLRCGQPDW